ncbi:MAG: electron transport complex subunit E [Candidatus Brocadiales bacterium]|nr:electron transport complex subunit E [Candidatus Bathyanammoxibius amoris]
MNKEHTIKYEFTKGLWAHNPLFVALLGMCPALAVTTTVSNGLAMGTAVILVMMLSNILISSIRNHIPKEVRIPCFIVVIAAFVTMVELLMKAYLPPEINESLGIFIPLIVVNCAIMYRAEDFASKHGVFRSAIDGAGMGIGFTVALVTLSVIREAVGMGTILGIRISESYQPASVMIMAPGAFLVLGLLLAYFNWRKLQRGEKI